MFGLLTEARTIKQRVQSLVQLNLELASSRRSRRRLRWAVAGGLAVK
jgi:hypothetical protein